MPEPREARSIVEQAEQAAAAGNYASAEDLLREAAALQERTLGAQHPDLANTLNNLGIVCEITDNPIDAEHYFRRAHAIAAATLAPDHPFVATSRKNLHDFCAARGRPVELPPSPPAVAAWLEAPAPAAPRREPSPSAAGEDAPPPVGKKSLHPLALGGLGGVALLIVIVTMVRPWGGAGELKGRPEGRPLPAEGGPLPPPSPAPSPAEPIAQPQPTATAAQPTRGETEAAGGARPATTERSTAMPTEVAAQLCTALANWPCQTADSEGSRGADVLLHTSEIRIRPPRSSHRLVSRANPLRRGGPPFRIPGPNPGGRGLPPPYKPPTTPLNVVWENVGPLKLAPPQETATPPSPKKKALSPSLP